MKRQDEEVIPHLALKAIGVVHSSLKTVQDPPPEGQHRLQEAVLEIFPRYCLGLAGLEKLRRIVVIYWLHQSEREVLRVYPGGDRNKEMIGVFCNRSPLRPNPIGIGLVDVLGVDVNRIRVCGLDAVNGTPILDLKAPSP